MAQSPLVRPQPRGVPGFDAGPFVQMGMGPAIEQASIPEQPLENPPTRFVGPGQMNIDPNTMEIAPLDYLSSVKDAAKTAFVEMLNQRDPQSDSLIKAVESGYAGKKLIGPIEEVRRAIRTGDEEMIGQAGLKLQKILAKNEMTFGERFADAYLGTGIAAERERMASKMAADVVMNELMRPQVEEALNLGFLQPQELTRSQVQPVFQHLIPQEPFAFTPEGEPVSTVQPALTPAVPGQAPSEMQVRPDARLTPLQYSTVLAKQEALKHPKAQTATGLNEFLIDLQGRVAAHVEKTGQEPTKQELSVMIQGARGQFEKEPIAGGKQEKKLEAQIGSDLASTEKVKEQTITERMTRLPNLKEQEARITNLQASAKEHEARASMAAQRGELAEYRAQLEQARALLAEARNQVSAVLLPALELDIPKSDRVAIINQIQKMLKTGISIEHTPGFMGLDIGKPSGGITIEPRQSVVPAPPVPQAVPQSTPQVAPVTPSQTTTAIDPALQQQAEALTQKRLEKLKKSLGNLSDEEARLYKDLRSRGIGQEQAMEELLDLRKRLQAEQ